MTLRRNHARVLIVTLLVAIGILCAKRSSTPADPIIEGQRLSQHLASLGNPQLDYIEYRADSTSAILRVIPRFTSDRSPQPETIRAIQMAGVAAHPMILEMLRSNPSKPRILLDAVARTLAAHLPLGDRLLRKDPPETQAYYQRWRAVLAISFQGTNARPLTQNLLGMQNDPMSPDAASVALMCLKP